MTFILISGQTNVGKSSVFRELHKLIDNDPNYATLSHPKILVKKEVLRHYENKNNKYHIVLNSASDNDYCMERFAKYLDKLGAPNGMFPDIIVTAVRDDDTQNDQMSRMLALLEAAEKGTQNLAQYYTSVIMQKPIHTPFALEALGSHAFVLHMERRQASGNALVQYWNSIATKAKNALDLAVARL